MITVTNSQKTCLVIPRGAEKDTSLILPPEGTTKVEKLSAALKDAEAKGLITISYPVSDKKPAKTTTKTSGKKTPAKETE